MAYHLPGEKNGFTIGRMSNTAAKNVEEINQLMPNSLTLLFPHQLFKKNPAVDKNRTIYLVEETLFFNQYPFHKQKIAFHRASMQCYKDYLEQGGYQVNYVEAKTEHSDVRNLISHLLEKGTKEFHIIDPTDFWLMKRIKECVVGNTKINWYENPLFLNKTSDLESFFRADKKKFHQTTWYKDERKNRNILIDSKGNPEGGDWTYDKENRKKYPKKKTPPPVAFPNQNDYYKEAVTYTEKHFPENYGELHDMPPYPTSFKATQTWLDGFLNQRFHEFGIYEDAIVTKESILNHSVLTPMLNVGLILPQEIVDRALDFAKNNNVPINSTEGFVRQIIGWREFMRGMYECKGVQQRTTNFWGFERKLPQSFYTGETGIPPIDETIKRILRDGYCHHIERLMILGNFMVLCEIDPDDVYQWFMELFIDAYDWVMVPNVYGMSQFADGGLLATKPYISGSNYILKMSDYEKGDWQAIWDGLFWRFMHVNRDFFEKNPRLAMLVRNLDKMSNDKREAHLKTANDFLEKL